MVRAWYRLGRVVFRVEADEPYEESEMVRPFRVDEAAADHVVRVRFGDDLPPGPAAWEEDGVRCAVHCYPRAGDEPRYWADWVRAGDGWTELMFSTTFRGRLSSRRILEGADVFRVLAAHGGVVLHASYVYTAEGAGVLFSGPCGIGKSTQAELWRRHAGAEVVNGDRALVCVGAEGATAHGIFFAGTSGICRARSAPLRGVVLLGQAEENTIRRAGAKEAFAALLSQCSYRMEDAGEMAQVTEIVARLVSSVPVWRLDCRPEESAVRLLEETMRRENDGAWID